jgi:hypothetical protein
MTQAENSSPDDFLLLFPPEVNEPPAVAETQREDPLPREAQLAPQHLIPASDTARPIEVAPRVSESRKVPQVGINVSPIGFIFGAAVGAFGMWMFSVSPRLPVVTAIAHTAPSTTVSAAPGPASAGITSGEMPVTPEPRAPVSAEPTPVDVNDDVDREDVTAAVPPVPDLGREASADETPSRPFTGSLVLNSDPQGAHAFVNGKPVGSTPVILSGLPVGSRVVRIEAEGYQAWSAAIRVVADAQTRVSATLSREQPRP